MLQQLSALGYEFRQVTNDVVDLALPPPDTWRDAPGPWERLPPFPTAACRPGAVRCIARRAQKRNKSPMELAYLHDFVTHSTNLIARRSPTHRPPAVAWPSLSC